MVEDRTQIYPVKSCKTGTAKLLFHRVNTDYAEKYGYKNLEIRSLEMKYQNSKHKSQINNIHKSQITNDKSQIKNNDQNFKFKTKINGYE